MAKNREIDVGRLCQAMQASRGALVRFREERRDAVRQLVGHHYSDQGADGPVPANLIALYVSVVGRNLIAKNPRVLLTTFDKAAKPMVAAMQAWANREVVEMKLEETLQRVVTDALFSVGVVKVALAEPAEAAAASWQLGAGQPFCERVDLDDLVFDPHARDFEHAGFVGHRYRVPLAAVKESKWYSKERRDLVPSEHQQYNLEGDERIDVIGRGQVSQDEFEDMVDLWEVYLPRHRKILTLADSQLAGASSSGRKMEALREQAWLGPYCGPYHFLAYGVVPGNCMPKAPVMDLIDLHMAANQVLRKIIRTIERIKELTGVAVGATEDGDRIRKASDGEVIQLNRPEAVKSIVTAGTALQAEVAIFGALKDLFVYLGGNLDSLGGLSPQAKTLGQDQLLSQNASRTVSDMQDRTVNFTASVLRALCWYWHHDPFKVQKSSYAVPGLPGVGMTRQVTPQMRQQGRFEDLDIRVDPYSLAHKTPEQRLSALNQIIQTIVLPLMPLIQQQGISMDLNRYLQKAGEYLDMPDLAEVVAIQAAPPAQTKMGAEAASPAQTTRSYVRENRPGQTREASDRNMIATMLGHDMGGNPNGNGQVR